MKLNIKNRIPRDYNAQTFANLMQDIERSVNLLCEERLTAFDNATDTAPALADMADGDFRRKRTLAEAGSGGSKYVLVGWYRVAGVILPARVLTGN